MLDPFLPENPEDVKRLKAIQQDIHEDFIALVKARAAQAQWPRKGLVLRRILDRPAGLGTRARRRARRLARTLRERYGDKVVMPLVRRSADCSDGACAGRGRATCGSRPGLADESFPRSKRARCGRVTDCNEEATMPLPAIPPLFVWALGALGAAAVVKVVAREWRRVNAELDEVEKNASGRGARDRSVAQAQA